MRRIMIIVLLSILLFIMVGCGAPESSVTNTTTITTTKTTTIDTSTPTKSDSQQIIDTVLAYIEAESDSDSSKYSYWYDGIDGYPSSENDLNYHTRFYLSLSYDNANQGKLGYDFPKIQDSLAVFDVSFVREITLKRSIFRFNLQKTADKGWRITDLRIVYTESSDMKPYVQ